MCKFITRLLLSMTLVPVTVQSVYADQITVYSSRNASYIKPLFDQYSRETGTGISYLIAPAAQLVNRLAKEGQQSPADLVILTGAENLWQASQLDLLSPVQSRTLQRNVPAHLKSEQNDWFGLSYRTRVLAYHPDRVDPSELSGYAGLADPEWDGRLCLDSSVLEYNRSLVAMLIKDNGEEKARSIVQGWVNNLAIDPPLQDDMQNLEMIETGLCDVALINNYYFFRFKLERPDTEIRLFWPDQNTTGIHLNITGAAVTANSSNKERSLDLLEWLTTRQPQVSYTRLSMEYPVNPDVYPVRELGRLGKFKGSQHNLSYTGEFRQQALKLMQQSRYR